MFILCALTKKKKEEKEEEKRLKSKTNREIFCIPFSTMKQLFTSHTHIPSPSITQLLSNTDNDVLSCVKMPKLTSTSILWSTGGTAINTTLNIR
jgi:hypothetical protein